eukprot:2570212-Alexandrium_andersonii.AAC.1
MLRGRGFGSRPARASPQLADLGWSMCANSGGNSSIAAATVARSLIASASSISPAATFAELVPAPKATAQAALAAVVAVVVVVQQRQQQQQGHRPLPR